MMQYRPKQWAPIWAVVLLAGFSLFSLLGKGQGIDDELKLALKQEALVRAVKESINILEERMHSEKEISDVISGSASKHRELVTSKSRILKWEQTHLEKDVRKQIRLTSEYGDYGLTDTQIEEFISEYSKTLNEFVSSLLESQTFSDRYKIARRKAVENQREVLEHASYPNADDIAMLVGTYGPYSRVEPPSVSEVQRKKKSGIIALAERYGTKAADRYDLFRENEKTLITRLTHAIEDGIAQYWQQHVMVEEYQGGTEIERNAITREINNLLEGFVKGAEDAGRRTYGIFDSVTTNINRRAEALEREKLERYVRREKEKGCLQRSITQAVIRVNDLTYREVPSTLGKHEQRLKDEYRETEIRGILSARGGIVRKQSHREAFRTRMRSMLNDSGAVGERFRELLSHCVKGTKGAPNHLESIRTKLAEVELREKKPSLANYMYEFGMDDLVSLRTRAFLTHYEGELVSDNGLRMEETGQLFESRKSKLEQEAKAVINRLYGIVDADEIKNRYRTLVLEKLSPEIAQRKKEVFKAVDEKLSVDFDPNSKATYARASDVSQEFVGLIDWEAIKQRIFEGTDGAESSLERMVTEYYKEVAQSWIGGEQTGTGASYEALLDESRASNPNKYIKIVAHARIKEQIRANITDQISPILAEGQEQWKRKLDKKVEVARDKAIVERDAIRGSVVQEKDAGGNDSKSHGAGKGPKGGGGPKKDPGEGTGVGPIGGGGKEKGPGSNGGSLSGGGGGGGCDKNALKVCRVASEACKVAVNCMESRGVDQLCLKDIDTCKSASAKCSFTE